MVLRYPISAVVVSRQIHCIHLLALVIHFVHCVLLNEHSLIIEGELDTLSNDKPK